MKRCALAGLGMTLTLAVPAWGQQCEEGQRIEVSFAQPPAGGYVVEEGDSGVRVYLTRTCHRNRSLSLTVKPSISVPYEVASQSGVYVESTDFSNDSEGQTVMFGQASLETGFWFYGRGDSLSEPDEVVDIHIVNGNPTSYDLGALTDVSVTILDSGVPSPSSIEVEGQNSLSISGSEFTFRYSQHSSETIQTLDGGREIDLPPGVWRVIGRIDVRGSNGLEPDTFHWWISLRPRYQSDRGAVGTYFVLEVENRNGTRTTELLEEVVCVRNTNDDALFNSGSCSRHFDGSRTLDLNNRFYELQGNPLLTAGVTSTTSTNADWQLKFCPVDEVCEFESAPISPGVPPDDGDQDPDDGDQDPDDGDQDPDDGDQDPDDGDQDPDDGDQDPDDGDQDPDDGDQDPDDGDSGGGGGGGDGTPPPSTDDDDDGGSTSDSGCERYVTPYWQGEAVVLVRPSNGSTAAFTLSCGGSTTGPITEYLSPNTLDPVLFREKTCDGSGPNEISITGIDPGGWYYVRGHRNAAVASLVCADHPMEAQPVVPAGVESARGTRGTFFRASDRQIAIVPDSARGTGRHVAPVWKGNSGGVAGRPTDGASMTVTFECGLLERQSFEVQAGADGVAVELLTPTDVCEEDEFGSMWVDGMEDGGWYWINGEANAAAAPLIRSDALGDVEAVNSWLDVEVLRYGSLFTHSESKLIGIVPHDQ